MKNNLFILLALLLSKTLFAQNISGVINNYTQVTNINVNVLTVNSSVGFNVGDKVMLIKMKGATIDQSNTASFGDTLSLGEVGQYAFSYIQCISPTSVTLYPYCANFGSSDYLQLVSVPVFPNPSVTATLTCAPWNGYTGGILIFETPGILTLNADIDVSSKGYLGGNDFGKTYNCSNTNFYTSLSSHADGKKGEGVAEYILNKESGRGKLANGGGGAYAGNAGAGGGANVGNGGNGGNEYSGCGQSGFAGIGGQAITHKKSALLMGGGGGGPQNDNNQTAYNGGNGGGIVFIAANEIIGNSYKIKSNGGSVPSTNDEGSSAGGAGGSVILNCSNYSNTLQIETEGGNGGSNYNTIFSSACHGTGGGGGGGLTWFSTSGLPANVIISSAGGLAGLILNPASSCYNTTYFAQNGGLGEVKYDFTAIGICATPPGAALHFDGTNDYVSIDNLTATTNSNYTIEGWFKTSLTNSLQDIVSGHTAGFQSVLVVEVQLNGTLRFLHRVPAGQTGGNSVYTTSVVNNGAWHHFAAVHGADELKIYLDGVLQGQSSLPEPLSPETLNIFLGKLHDETRRFQGSIDEIRFWNRALCAAEIVNNMNCEIATTGNALVANYHFNQGLAASDNSSPAINTLVDATGNGYTGTLNNFALIGNTSNWIAPGGIICGINCVAYTASEINLQGNSVTIFDGDASPSSADYTDFGNVVVGNNLVRTFTIQNTGSAVLNITSITSDNATYTISGAPSSVTAGDSATFNVTFSPTAVGLEYAIITINNNDCDEGVYNFYVQGTGTCTFPSIICSANVVLTPSSATCDTAYSYTTSSVGIPSPTITYSMSGATSASGSGNGSGTSFALGLTTVKVYVSNVCGIDSCTFTVTITDTTKPTINCIANITQNNDAGLCSAVVNYTAPVGTDNCSGASTSQAEGLASGSTFPIGTTINKFVVTDASGNKDSCTFTVTIVDTTKPTITCVANITQQNDAGLCSAVVTYTAPIGTDNCPLPTTSQTEGLASGATFPIGTTTNKFVVTDASGNKDSCEFTITINDLINPTISCNGDSTLNIETGTCGFDASHFTSCKDYDVQNITFAPLSDTGIVVSLSDDQVSSALNVGFNFNFYCNDYSQFYISSNGFITFNSDIFSGCCSGQLIPSGPSPNNLIAAVWDDLYPPGFGSIKYYTIGTAPFRKLVVNYNDVPFCCNSTPAVKAQIILYETTNQIEIHTTYVNNATPATQGIENADGTKATAVTDRNRSTWSATNDAHRFAPSNILTAPNNFITASDNCSTVTVTNSPIPAIFPIGTTSITYTATDASGNASACTKNITIVDNVPPTISCPVNITQNNELGLCSAVVNYTAPVGTDNCPLPVTTQTEGLASGATFPVGITINKFIVTDASGNKDSCTFTVTVVDTTKPTIVCPSNITQANDAGLCSATVNYAAPVVSDNCPNPPSPVLLWGGASGTSFPIGTSTITYGVPYQTVTYDFNSLTGGASINGQDGWLGASAGFSNVNTILVNNTTPFTNPQSSGLGLLGTPIGGGHTSFATRIDNGNFSIPDFDPDGIMTVQFDARQTYWGNYFQFGYDVNSNGHLSGGNEISFGVRYSIFGNNIDLLGSGGAVLASVPASSYSLDPRWRQFKLLIDKNANAGAGSISLSFRDVANNGPWIEVPALQNKIAGFNPSATDASNPMNINGMYYSHEAGDGPNENSFLDNIIFTKYNDCSFTVTIADTTKPTITCVANITQNNDANICGAIVNYTAPVGTDNCAGSTTAQTEGLASGATFPVGTTINKFVVTDASGNKDSCTFTVTINDTTKPSITCVANITQDNDAGLCSAVVNYSTPIGTDNCPLPTTSQTEGLASGATFPVGTTINKFVVTDASGNKDSCTFTVTITDTTKPSITCVANITQDNDANICGAIINYTAPVGTDNCPLPTTSQTEGLPSGSTFPIGTTINKFVVTDASGNKDSCTFTITINAAEIDVTGSGISIVDNDITPDLSDHTDFGQTTIAPITRTFTIHNIGTADLTLAANAITITGANSSLFTLSNITLPATVTSPTGSITFDVTYTPTTIGVHNATINIANNDCDEHPYNFNIQGERTCTIPVFTSCPSDTVNANTLQATCNSLVTYTTVSSGIPAPVYTYIFSGSTTNSGSGTGSGSIFTLGITTVQVIATNPCGSDTCTFLVHMRTPEMDVFGNMNSIADGDMTPSVADFTDFGNVSGNSSLTQTFFIYNGGTGNLFVPGFTVSGVDSATFTVSNILLPATVAPASYRAFDVTFTPGTSGLKNAILHIQNDDCDEHTYDFALRGNGTCTPSFASSTHTACDSFSWNMNTYTSGGVYTFTYTNAEGCDSVYTLNLTINNSNINPPTIANVCSTYVWQANGQTYTATGIYMHSFTNVGGCDSSATLHLTLGTPSSNAATTADVCDSYLWTVTGQTYTSSGTYTESFTNVSGCDSSYTLHLIVRNSSSSTSSVTMLGCYTWNANNVTYTVSGIHTITLTNAANCDSVLTLNLTITPSVTISAKALLSGAYNSGTGLMHDSLRVVNLIPGTEPYSMSPYFKTPIGEVSGETVSGAVLSVIGNNAIVDWIFIELRSALNPGTVIANKRALIQRDGDIVSAVDGTSPVTFATVYNGMYYVSIKHRNHIGIMSANAIAFSGCANSVIDFTTSLPVYANPIIANAPRKNVSGVYALWAADANNNKNAKYNGLSNDKEKVLIAVGINTPNNEAPGYRVEDLNMDGKVRYNNVDNDRQVILNTVGVSTPNVIISQHTPN